MSSRRLLPNGFTLMEMVVTIVLFGVIAAVGSQLIGKLVPSYLLSAQAQQSLSPREAALWRLSEDFRRALVGETHQIGCTIQMSVVSGMNGLAPNIHTVSYTWANQQLWMSGTAVSGLVLEKAVATACPLTLAAAGCGGRMCLKVHFSYPDPNNSDVKLPVSTILYSYVNGPFVSAISPVSGLSDGNNIAISLSGFFPLASGGWQRIEVISGTTTLFSLAPDTFSSTVLTTAISSTTSGVVDIRVVNPDGWSYLKQAFTFVSQ